LVLALTGWLALGLLGARLLARSITGPLATLQASAETLGKHAADGERQIEPIPIHSSDEIGRLARSFDEMALKIQQAIVELETINAIGNDINTIGPGGLDEVLRRITDQATGLLHVDVCLVLLRNEQMGCWIVEAASGEWHDRLYKTVMLWEELPVSVRAFETKKSAIGENLRNDLRPEVVRRNLIGESMLAIPLLSLVLASIAAQVGVAVECVVLEQSDEPRIADRLPEWVRYLHTPIPEGMPYSRSWAFNVGARAARGPLLVFHDNDMIVPRRYAAELLDLRRRGFEVINIKRFVFYLSAGETMRVLEGKTIEGPPERVIQNLEGGGSVAVDRETFFEIGGFDESFVGWGGEDNEFWERSSVRAVWPWGYVPLVHLHHAEQPEKRRRDRRTAAVLDERSRISPEERVQELTTRAFGRTDGPDPAYDPRQGDPA